MEPILSTDPALLGILEELKRREPIFHRSEFGTTRAAFEAMMHADFWEIGAPAGATPESTFWPNSKNDTNSPTKTYGRRANSTAVVWRPISTCLTYTLIQDEIRKTRRLTIWQHSQAGWKIVFHQGTVVEDP
jgi:hypothetical protein